MTASWRVTDELSFPALGILILGVAVCVLGGLHIFLTRTSAGRAMRATAQDPDTAALVGVNSQAVYARAAGIAIATAGLAALFLSLRGSFAPSSGPSQLIYAFEAVTIGGFGSLWGTLAGGLVLGVAQTIGSRINPQYAALAGHLVFLVIVTFRSGAILVRRRKIMIRGRQGKSEALQGLRVQRWTRVSRVFMSGVGLIAILLALVPLTLSANVVQKLTSLFILVMLAVTWNALAGYGGLLSVGQQAYFGIGAYATVLIAQNVNPYLAMVLAIVVTGLISVPISYVLLRLRGGQFSIATWVVAEAFVILVSLVAVLGAGTGISLSQLNRYTITQRQHFTFWLAFALMAGFIGAVFILVRSRTGMSLQAYRDDEEGAASVGVRVLRGKRILYILAAVGSGAAGGHDAREHPLHRAERDF